MNAWEIESITSVPKFLAAIARYVPAAHVVSFEIQNACAEARQVYAKHRSPVKLRPFRDTISPKTQLYYCVIRPALSDDLKAVLGNHEVKDVLWHVKGFSGFKLLFTIHDASAGGSACMSYHIDEEAVRAVASSVGRQPTKIQTYYDWDAEHRPKRS